MVRFDTEMKLRLREWRERRLLSQGELADKAGVGRATIARIETGALKTDPHFRTIRKLAAALEVKPEELIVAD